MGFYRVCFALHLASASLWLGHMFFWSLFSGPVLKKLQPPETAQQLRRLSFWMGGLGWPALTVLALTGAYMLSWRGVTLDAVLAGNLVTAKLALVLGMIGYQTVFAHRPAPRAIYFNMLAALLILGASVVIARS